MPAFTPPPSAPQRGDRDTFARRFDTFLTWLVTVIPQLNAFIAGLNARDLGGANTYVYTFDSTTGDADPGPGKLRLDGTPQNISNTLRVDNVADNGADISGMLTALGAVTSNLKGSVRLQKVNDPAAWMILDVQSVAGVAGYRNLAVTVRSSSGAAPFANGDSVAAFFGRNGDKGDSGGTPTQQQIRDAVGTMPIVNGGTGATTAAAALTNLGAMPASTAVLLRGVANNTTATRFDSTAMGSIGSIPSEAWDSAPITVTNGSNQFASAVIGFYRMGAGAYAAFFGLDTDNKWKVGGRSMGNAAYEIFHQGNFNPANYARLDGAAFTGNISAPSITNTSDERLKENWRPLTDEQLDALADMDLVGVFDWRDGSGASLGGSAQQIRAIVPEAVREDANGMLSVEYGGLSFAIVQAQLRRAKQERT